MEDSLVISLQIIGALFILVIIASCIVMWLHRDELIIRSTVLPINTALSVGYIVCTITPIFTTAGPIPCIPYLYLGSLNEILLASAYIALAWHMIAMVAVTRRKILEAAAMAQEEGSNEDVDGSASVYQSELRMKMIRLKVEDDLAKRRFSWIENWMARRDWTAKTSTALKIYFGVLGGFLILPILVNIIDPTYHSVDTECSNRTTIEIGELAIIIVACLVSLIYILAKIWKLKSPFGEKQRLAGMIVSWIVLLILLFATGTVNSPVVETLYKIISIVGIIELWAVGNVTPLLVLLRMKIRGESSESSTSGSETNTENAEKAITMEDVIYYDYSGDDPVLNFAERLDAERTPGQGFFTYTIMVLRKWKTSSEKTDNTLMLSSIAYRQYYESIRSEAGYPMIVEDGIRGEMSEVIKRYESIGEHDDLEKARCDTPMKMIVEEAKSMLKTDFFKGYVKTRFYGDFVAKFASNEIILMGFGKSESTS